MRVALTAYLLAQAGLSGLLGNRIGWGLRPQLSGLPAMTLTLVSPGIDYHHGGATALQRARVQADCWGRSTLECDGVAQALRTAVEAMHEARGAMMLERGFVDTMLDAEPEDIGGGNTVFRTITDFFVWHYLL